MNDEEIELLIELIEEGKSGNSEKYIKFLEKYAIYVWKEIQSYAKNFDKRYKFQDEDYEDIAGEAFLIFQKIIDDQINKSEEILDKLSNVKNLKSYLYKVARNSVNQIIRKQKRKKQIKYKTQSNFNINDEENDIANKITKFEEDKIELEEFEKALDDCMKKLPNAEFETISLCEFGFNAPSDIAIFLNISTISASQRLHQARKKLDECLKSKGVKSPFRKDLKMNSNNDSFGNLDDNKLFLALCKRSLKRLGYCFPETDEEIEEFEKNNPITSDEKKLFEFHLRLSLRKFKILNIDKMSNDEKHLYENAEEVFILDDGSKYPIFNNIFDRIEYKNKLISSNSKAAARKFKSELPDDIIQEMDKKIEESDLSEGEEDVE